MRKQYVILDTNRVHVPLLRAFFEFAELNRQEGTADMQAVFPAILIAETSSSAAPDINYWNLIDRLYAHERTGPHRASSDDTVRNVIKEHAQYVHYPPYGKIERQIQGILAQRLSERYRPSTTKRPFDPIIRPAEQQTQAPDPTQRQGLEDKELQQLWAADPVFVQNVIGKDAWHEIDAANPHDSIHQHLGDHDCFARAYMACNSRKFKDELYHKKLKIDAVDNALLEWYAQHVSDKPVFDLLLVSDDTGFIKKMAHIHAEADFPQDPQHQVHFDQLDATGFAQHMISDLKAMKQADPLRVNQCVALCEHIINDYGHRVEQMHDYKLTVPIVKTMHEALGKGNGKKGLMEFNKMRLEALRMLQQAAEQEERAGKRIPSETLKDYLGTYVEAILMQMPELVAPEDYDPHHQRFVPAYKQMRAQLGQEIFHQDQALIDGFLDHIDEMTRGRAQESLASRKK